MAVKKKKPHHLLCERGAARQQLVAVLTNSVERRRLSTSVAVRRLARVGLKPPDSTKKLKVRIGRRHQRSQPSQSYTRRRASSLARLAASKRKQDRSSHVTYSIHPGSPASSDAIISPAQSTCCFCDTQGSQPRQRKLRFGTVSHRRAAATTAMLPQPDLKYCRPNIDGRGIRVPACFS